MQMSQVRSSGRYIPLDSCTTLAKTARSRHRTNERRPMRIEVKFKVSNEKHKQLEAITNDRNIKVKDADRPVFQSVFH